MDFTQPRPLAIERGPNRPCQIEGCDRTVGLRGARGWCTRHYQRWQKTGSPTGSSRPPAEQRFFSKIRQEGDCWIWTASKDGSGYGMFSNSAGRGKKWTERAHRWSYAYLRCEIPAGLEIDHLCRNRDCVNPWHLEPVTPLVNWERGISPWRLNDLKERCHQGHPFTPDNTYYHPVGSRVCRRCRAMYQQKYNERQTQKRSAA